MKRKQIYYSFLLLASLLFLYNGCDLLNVTPGPEYNIEIRTEKEIYTIPFSVEQSPATPSLSDPTVVSYTAVNLGNASVYYLSPWHYVTLEKKTNGAWKNLGSWYGYIAIGPFINEFAPGDTLIPIELRLTDEIIDGPGYYRFIFDFYKDRDMDSKIPLRHRISNTFEVRKP